MQRIISHGNITKKKNRTTCEECKCDFTYDVEDVHIGKGVRHKNLVKYVYCPECLNQVAVDSIVKFIPYYLIET